jgi:hypothetical protein
VRPPPADRHFRSTQYVHASVEPRQASSITAHISNQLDQQYTPYYYYYYYCYYYYYYYYYY